MELREVTCTSASGAVPQVLRSCTEFVEEHGIVDGIYRLCGIASNVQKLRQEFDMERTPDLNKSTYLQDVHCVSSLCKAYFRELPNPLLTYQLYDKFAEAVAIQLEEQRLIKIREVLQELPPQHFRTLEYLMRHLVFMASFSGQTNMHVRNLAIVWAPNLLRSKDIESSGFNGTAAFMEVRVQSIVVEFILTHVEQLFGVGTIPGKENDGGTSATMNWPSCVPEDYYRSLSYNLPSMLNHGDGPPQIRPYHTIIEFSENKRKGSVKAKKWRSIFNLGRSGHDSKRKSQKQDEKDGKSDTMNLRPAKSMDSLSAAPYTPDASDLQQSYLNRLSPKNQLPIRRESFGAHPKQEKTGYGFVDFGEQSLPMETNEAQYEEQVQAKSEPTTPKVGRSSVIGTPQGRSPKSNQNRAEKCVGVHISGPFSVTLPFHITSNLSRLTRGMEIPSLNYPSFHRSSEKLFSLEASRESTESSIHHAWSSLPSDTDHHGTLESSVREEGDPMENNQILCEVQDTFSFLDSQEASPEAAAADHPEEETLVHRTPEYSVAGEILEYELQREIQMEEFSVEPPPDDPCTEDETEQMYFMAIGCPDVEQQWRETHDSLEDIYLSAYDDLSPLVIDSDEVKLGKDHKIQQESEDLLKCSQNQKYCISNADPLKVRHDDEPQPSDASYRQTDVYTVYGPPNNIPEAGVHYTLRCNLGATTENVDYKDESCTVKPQTVPDDEVNAQNLGVRESQTIGSLYRKIGHLDDEATIINVGSREFEGGHIYSKDDTPENMAIVESPCLEEPQGGGSYYKDDNLENEATVDSPSPEEPQAGGSYCKDDNVEEAATLESPCLEEPQSGGSYYKYDNLESEATGQSRGPEEPQAGGSNCKDDNLEEEATMQSPCHEEPHSSVLCSSKKNLGLRAAVKNLVSIEIGDYGDYSRVDNFLEAVTAVGSGTSEGVMAYIGEPMDILAEKEVTLLSVDYEGEPPGSLVNMPILYTGDHSGQQKADDKVNMPGISLSRIDGAAGSQVETAAEEHWGNEESNWDEHKSSSGNQLCFRDDFQTPLSSAVEDEEMMNSLGLSDIMNLNPLPKDHSIQQDGSTDLKQQEFDPNNSYEEQRRSPVLQNTVISGTYPNGSVGMSLASTTNKIQQAKSVPIVPPKPQFAKLPPALKSKLHVASSLSTKPQKPEKSPADCSRVSTPKRRSSWRNATSVSFDTAMALAKERQQSQNPVRRMQTYCIGDSYEIMDSSKSDNTSHFQKITITSANSRANRPYSYMSPSAAELELWGENRGSEEPNVLTIHRSQPLLIPDPDAYTKVVPHRNRLSMPQLGRQATGDDLTNLCQQQRQSLL
ncbi:rho GTPase-activating protein 30 isoform X2 [Pseudophryne corroboree]|uniref:rho GTPase-activating protein 30 isoform X2 n=1 Tax=Pseudophryne corroboree TaxID=495146 RepID=UPI0030814504